MGVKILAEVEVVIEEVLVEEAEVVMLELLEEAKHLDLARIAKHQEQQHLKAEEKVVRKVPNLWILVTKMMVRKNFHRRKMIHQARRESSQLEGISHQFKKMLRERRKIKTVTRKTVLLMMILKKKK